jgi:hypothetical protein
VQNRKVDYKIWSNFDTWTLAEALNILSELALDDLTCSDQDYYNKLLEEKRSIYRRKLKDSLDVFYDNIVYHPTSEEFCDIDEYGDYIPYVNFNKTTVEVKRLIRWLYSENPNLPEEFIKLIAGRQGNDTKSDDKHSDTPKETSDEGGDIKYPDYKGVKFDELDKKKFDELKKYYKMLQLEESKWRRSITIAAKIGLLFYERSLNKPTTRPAFLEKYKQEFDSMLKNDTVANHIYDNLPEEYRGGSGTPVCVPDFDVIINAATFAGAQAGDRESMNIISLKKSMKLENIAQPSDDVIEKIIVSVKQLDIEDDG